MKRLLIILMVLSVAACQAAKTPVTQELLVVEGWIEDGGAPYIYITTSFTPSAAASATSSISDHVLTSARVTISDGEREEALIGLASNRFFPPFVYTTGHMRGVAGKTYTLTIDADKYHATATTTIPPSRELESLSVIPYGDAAGEHLLEARFRNMPADDLCYMGFVKIEKTDSTYVPAEMSLTDGALAGEDVSITVRPGRSVAREEIRNSFRSGERVLVKFRTMDRGMHGVWKQISEQHGLSAVPFFVMDQNLSGNIQGAQGYFAGYGCTNYSVAIP